MRPDRWARGGIMSVQADIYVALDDAKAVRYCSEPATFKDREQYRSFTVLELSTLWAKMRGTEWDVGLLKGFPTVFVQNGGEESISRLPAAMVAELTTLTAEHISTAAAKWAATDELACKPSDVQPIVEGLVGLAKRASVTGGNVYFWNCV
jgi:hypothetical protein